MEKRKRNRLEDYDYSLYGSYFITICTRNKQKVLSEFVGERSALPQEEPKLILTDVGEIVDKAIQNISTRYEDVQVDKYCIMPNHIHLILTLFTQEDDGSAMRSPTIPTIVNQMKGFVTKQIGYSVWQRSYFDHIIRNEKSYQEIWDYIHENPIKWENDEYF